MNEFSLSFASCSAFSTAPAIPSFAGVKTSSAPKSSRSFLLSMLIDSGIVSMSLYPFAAQMKALGGPSLLILTKGVNPTTAVMSSNIALIGFSLCLLYMITHGATGSCLVDQVLESRRLEDLFDCFVDLCPDESGGAAGGPLTALRVLDTLYGSDGSFETVKDFTESDLVRGSCEDVASFGPSNTPYEAG